MNYRQKRKDLLKWVKEQLIGGEKLADDILIENNPFDRYVTGILYPISEVEEVVEDDVSDEDSEDASFVKKSIRYQPPSSMGFSFYMKGGDQSLRVFFQAAIYSDKGKKNHARSWGKTSLCQGDGEELEFHSRDGAALSKVVFEGRGRIDVVFRAHDHGQIATITLTNVQQFDECNSPEKDLRKAKAERSLFEVNLKCFIDNKIVFDYPSVNKALLSDEEKEIELRYKDERVYAVGHGVAVDWEQKSQGLLTIFSDFMPVVEVPQVTTDTSADSSKALAFDFLVEIETNSSVLDELDQYVDEYDKWVRTQQKMAENEHADDKETSARVIENMLIAKQRMKQGILLLKHDSLARKAFSIANLTMLVQMRGSLGSTNDKKYKWRPFQLAFVLMVLESAVNEDSDFRDLVDLIWFPTGGGKTEAYLGLMAFLFAYRRMRYPASSGGTIAIMRYTLRLLTSQQFMRACKVISALELIRQSNIEDLGKEPFSVGLWLGAATSPNTFKQAQEKIKEKQYSKLVLTSCPWCSAKFSHKNYITSEDEFHFTCLNDSCDFGQKPNNILPYNVVDDALYKNPPSLLIATVDKFARFTWEDRAASFFGKNINRPPELIIQDELHLISGALGSIVGLYEAGFETVLLTLGVRVKYIASTATIKNAKEQIKALFARDMSIFPPVGLRHNDSYYAKTVALEEKPGRLYIGYMAFGLARVKSMEPLAGALLAAPAKLFNGDDVSTDAWWTQVIYHGSLKGVGNSRTNYQSGVLNYYNKLNELNFLDDLDQEQPGLGRDLMNPKGYRIDEKYPPDVKDNEVLKQIHDQYYPIRNLTIKSLTSNQTAQENADIFDALGLLHDSNDSIDVALATNMISVGLDVSRLALMIINGQPLTTAEYIQASSRVGRGDVPGMVFANYYKTQARSLSHYENFRSYHTTFYRYVEPSSVTPFTFQVRQRALHATLVIAMRLSGIGLLDNKGAENFDPDQVAVKKVIKLLKIRIKNASINNEDVEKTIKHIDCLVDEWRSEVERCNDERLNLRYNPADNAAEALLISYESEARARGVWKTLNSMRNVEKTGLFKIVKGLNDEKL
ncbi:MAG: helicase-related protein [Cycloclasticus sp.]|nr:helicase-related protein [Cycloclasticus sp.]